MSYELWLLLRRSVRELFFDHIIFLIAVNLLVMAVLLSVSLNLIVYHLLSNLDLVIGDSIILTYLGIEMRSKSYVKVVIHYLYLVLGVFVEELD